MILLLLSVMVTQLGRMVANLMTDAVELTSDGDTVEVTLRSDAEMSETVVKDDGDHPTGGAGRHRSRDGCGL